MSYDVPAFFYVDSTFHIVGRMRKYSRFETILELSLSVHGKLRFRIREFGIDAVTPRNHSLFEATLLQPHVRGFFKASEAGSGPKMSSIGVI